MSDNEKHLSPPILSVNNESLATAWQVPSAPDSKRAECVHTYVCLFVLDKVSVYREGGVSCLCIMKEACHVCVS